MANGNIVKIVWTDPKPNNARVLSGLDVKFFKVISLHSLSLKDILGCCEKNRPSILVICFAEDKLRFSLSGVINQVKLAYPNLSVGAACGNTSFEVLRHHLDFRVPETADATCINMLLKAVVSVA